MDENSIMFFSVIDKGIMEWREYSLFIMNRKYV